MDADTNILFQWKAPTSDFVPRMVIAFIAAITIHGLCFYIFQVQEPQSARALPRTFEITYLAPDDLNARLILQQIDDYHAAYESTLLADSPLNMPLPTLDYHPTYQSFKPSLMPLPESHVLDESSFESVGEFMVLPSIPAWKPVGNGSLRRSSPGIVVTEGLQLILPQEWKARYLGSPTADWAAAKGIAPEDGRVSWRLSIHPEGRVEEAFPLTEMPNEALKEAVRRLSFMPRKGNALEWLEVHLQW
ncbi:MAG: hypothetical protein ACI957_003342 [Verrucomicrobiales bacterium]|jgi:hypothetical protein